MTARVSSSATPDLDTTGADVLADVRNHIGHLTLNRPAGLNALTLDMIRALQQQLDAWAHDPEVNAVVLRGAGERAFCAAAISARCMTATRVAGRLHEDFFVEEYALDLAIHHYRKPVLALMDGFVLAAAWAWCKAPTCGWSPNAVALAMPEVAIGYFPDVGGSHFLPRIPGELGIYLGVSGVQIRAADALYCAWPTGT